ncbi:hypothetical protein [Photobacterium damselae]|uniref:hypothetical protein n=1 Tax=Photobacterium damselae TaxID=38293 RepID=UPI001F386351|nr:hypothetical protein [Photobacterium damselae]UKA12907.1 hypothetical protein IHC91_21555 [Photobacterium damselae subsp. damselae]
MKQTIYELDRLAREKLGAPKHSSVKARLHKSRLSYIGILNGYACHCLENDIKPVNLINDLINCCNDSIKNNLAIKIDSAYSCIRGNWSSILYQPEDTDPQGQPEQRGKFICSCCHLVKTKKEKSKRKSYPTFCEACAIEAGRDQARKYYKKPKAKEPDQLPVVNDEPIEQPEPVQELEPLKPLEVVEAVKPVEPVEFVGEVIKPKQKPKSSSLVKINQIMGDSEDTQIELSLPTSHLHLLLAAVSNIRSMI